MPKKEQTNDVKKTDEKGARSKEKEPEKSIEPEVLSKHGYRVMGRVGKGSFADVRMAFSSSQKKNIAVKIIPKHKISDKELVRRFIPREIRVLRQINHPNIIKFFRSIETMKTIYIFMELAENGDLLQVIKREKMIDERRACRWFHHIVDGLAYLHSKGIVHRDLKCENLLLDKHNVIKLTDFGFTRDGMPFYLIGDKENKNREIVLSATYCGSFAYASPEVLQGKPYEPNMSDVWSIGVVLYITVHGRLPFDDSDFNGLLKQVREAVGFPTTPQVSDSCKKLIRGILAPLEVRWYIPEIREDEWYNLMWNYKYETLYQRKCQLETDEEPRKRFDQAAYKGRRKDITKYERAATLRRYISEKERLRIIKTQLEEEEVKLRKINASCNEISDKDQTLAKEKTTLNGKEANQQSRKVSYKADEESQDISQNYSRNMSSEVKKEVAPSTSVSAHCSKMVMAKCSSEKITSGQNVYPMEAPITIKDTENTANSINSNVNTNQELAYLDGDKTLEQKKIQCIEKSKVSISEQLSGPDLPLSEVDIPGLIMSEKIAKTPLLCSTIDKIGEMDKILNHEEEKVEKDKCEKYFKDINEAILEYNKPAQQSKSPLKSISRAKEISSQRFCRKSSQRVSNLSDDIQYQQRHSDQLIKENWKVPDAKKSLGNMILLDSDDDDENDLIIETFEMPQTLIEGGFQEVELSVHGSLSNISIAQLIKDIEEDIKEDENDTESQELVTRYKRISEEQ